MNYSAEQLQELYDESQAEKHLYSEKAGSQSSINDSFKFKDRLLNLNSDIKKILTDEILLANLSDRDKKKAIDYLSLALDLKEIDLDGSAQLFVNEVRLLAGISRGHRGFQQDKFTEQRDIRVSQLESTRSKRGNWFKQ
jgi:hypothetical protein